MKTRVQKWGNSLAIRIPKAYVQEVGLEDNTLVELSLADGTLSITLVPAQPLSLDALLAQVTDENIHGEHATGSAQGNESW